MGVYEGLVQRNRALMDEINNSMTGTTKLRLRIES
jgi:hypothetical protein